MALNTVTLTWDFANLIQWGETGTLSIAPTQQLTDATDGLIVAATPQQVTFTGGAGQLAGIVANDNTNIQPAGTGYTITATAPGGQVIYGPATVIINFGAGAVQDLSSLTPAVLNPVVAASLTRPAWQFTPETYGALGNGRQALVSTANGNAVINTTPIGAPGAPALSNAGSGGSLTAGTYGVKVTFVNQWGETVASAATAQAISGTQPLTITSPTPTRDATGYYAYVTQPGGSTYTRQQASPVPIENTLVLTTTPTSSGVQPPGSDGTAAQVFTSTLADGGKNIMINGGLGFGAPYMGTIASVQSPTQATLSDTGITATNTGCPMVFSSDDRIAINACVQAGAAYALAHNNIFEVVFSDKIYGLGSGLYNTANTTDPSGLSYNTQVKIPVASASEQTAKLEVKFTGPGDNAHTTMWTADYVDLNGASLVSYMPVGPNPWDPIPQSAVGAPGGGINFNGSLGHSNTQFISRGIQYVSAGWQNGIMLYLPFLDGCRLSGSSIAFAPSATGPNPTVGWPPSTFFFPTHKVGAGVYLPEIGNNDDVVVESWASEGYPYGVVTAGDHVTISRLCTINCGSGIRFHSFSGGAHPLTIDQWSCEGNHVNIDGANGNTGHIAIYVVLDDESTAGTVTDVIDPNNSLYGVLRWNDWVRVTPTITGGGNLKIVNDMLGPGHWASPPAVPLTTVAQQNTAWRDATVAVHAGSGVTVTAVTIDGTVTGLTVAASTSLTVRVPSGKNITLAYSGGTPTWDWWLD